MRELVNLPGEVGSIPAKSSREGFMEEVDLQELSFVWDPVWNLVPWL